MIRGTLVSDGRSDRVLIPILEWLLREHTTVGVSVEWADTSRVRSPPLLSHRIQLALTLRPCELLFVHRDAEAQSPRLRRDEIQRAVPPVPPHVCVIPVRMSEAWLLHDEAAVRRAADRPSGTVNLRLPKLSAVERHADPKATLYQALRIASERSGRRLRNFDCVQGAQRVSELISEWSALRALGAFQELEADVQGALRLLAERRQP